jgi:vancomycin resistance protein YoaR
MLKYIIAIVVALPVMVLLVIGGAYAYDEVIAADRVSHGVFVIGHDVSRLTADEVAAIARAYEDSHTSQPVIVEIDGTPIEVDPVAAGIEVDEDAIAQQAMSLRREEGITENFVAWFSSWRSSESIEIPISVDDEAIRSILEDVSETAINTPAVDGAVTIVDGQVTPQYPTQGMRLDIDSSVPIVREQMLRTDREAVSLPVEFVSAPITKDHVDAAVEWANRLVSSRVTLKALEGDGQIIFTKAALKAALRSELVNDPDKPIRVYLDRESLVDVAARSEEDFNTEPVNARIAWNSSIGNLAVVPSIPGQSLDVEAVADIVPTMAASGLRSKTVPVIDGIEAEYSTEDAATLGPFGRVSSFTTYHPCCQSKNTNIQLIARAINGAMVMPGETFSINTRVGKRTESKGYVRAGAIISGRIQCCDSPINVGGGTSQFATTFYNAVFFGCYQDVFHKPHSLYFSRYPFVREATLGFPSPDVKFRNDSAAPVYIATSTSGTSVTVSLYGNNGGRTCTSSRSGNTVTRTMKHADGTVRRQHWAWNYRQPTKDGPTTTTSTAPSTTTTTASSSTTAGSPSTTQPQTTTTSSTPSTTQATTTTTTTTAASTTTTEAGTATTSPPDTTTTNADG